jgi:membrane associated rhomboid family serine protease
MFPLRDTIPSQTFPFVTLSLILINLLIFLYEVSLGAQLNSFIYTFGVIPLNYTTTLLTDPIKIIPFIPPLFTSIFLHGGWMHVISNMWYLWIFGDNIEDKTGHFRFLIFYLSCGILATIAHIFINPTSEIPTIGASGAIAGVMGAYILLFPRSKITTLIFLFIFIQIVEIRAIFFLGFWIVIQVISGMFSVGLTGQSGGVAWWAHIGGFLSGVLLVFIFKKNRRNKISVY